MFQKQCGGCVCLINKINISKTEFKQIQLLRKLSRMQKVARQPLQISLMVCNEKIKWLSCEPFQGEIIEDEDNAPTGWRNKPKNKLSYMG